MIPGSNLPDSFLDCQIAPVDAVGAVKDVKGRFVCDDDVHPFRNQSLRVVVTQPEEFDAVYGNDLVLQEKQIVRKVLYALRISKA